MRSVDASFIAEELSGIAADVAKHRYGCRIFCRLLEHCASEISTMALIDELLAEASGFCRHNFAHHVIASVLEHSPLSQKQRVVDALCCSMWSHISDRNSNFVMEHVLTHCAIEAD